MRPIDTGKLKAPETITPGTAPMLQWLPIDQLVIDDAYQRELKQGNWAIIQRIANAFTWTRFSPVFVAPVEGGCYAIIDGQHRTHAAKLCGMKEVPCQIVPMERREQAAAFAAVNGMVTKVTVWQIYRAALAAGQSWAIKARDVAEAGGCRLMESNASHWAKRPGEIYAVRAFAALVERHPQDAVIAALRVLMAAEGWADAPEAWDGGIVMPVLAALCQRPQAVAREDFVRRFEMLDIWAIDDRITRDNRERIRKGLPYVAKKERLETLVLAWIDETFPAVMRLPA